jgi:hypothetical protein
MAWLKPCPSERDSRFARIPPIRFAYEWGTRFGGDTNVVRHALQLCGAEWH